jgi:hypothetical protein
MLNSVGGAKSGWLTKKELGHHSKSQLLTKRPQMAHLIVELHKIF